MHEIGPLPGHRAILERADRLASRAADLIEAAVGRPVLVLHSGAIEQAQIELGLQERDRADAPGGGSVEFLHRGAGQAGLRAAAIRIADHGAGTPHVVVVHAQASDSALAADADECSGVLDLFPGSVSVTCLFAGPHAAGAGFPALLRHTVLWVDGTELNTRSPEGRLVLLDHLLDQLDSPAQVRHLAMSPAISTLSGSAVDRLIARRLRALSPEAESTPRPSASGAPNCTAVCGALAGSDGLLAEMLAVASHVVDELLLEDAEFVPVIWHPPDRRPSSLSELITAGRLRRLADQLEPGIPELVRLGTPAAGHRIVARLGSKKPLGYLSTIAHGGNTDAAIEWLRHLAPVAAAEITHRASWPRLSSETRRQMVSLLAKGAFSRHSAKLAVEHLVGSLGARVAALDEIRTADAVPTTTAPPDDRRDSEGTLGRMLDSLGLPHGEHIGLVVALVDANDSSVDRLKRAVRQRAVAVGLGSTVRDPMELVSSARQAVYACQLAVSTRQRFLDFAAIGVHRLLLPGAEAGDPEFEEPIRRLEQAAATLRFDGWQTLASYLNTGGNLRRAAHDLLVHANTMRYRLDRIAEVIDVDLTDPEQCFRLQLAIRLRAGRRSLAESGLWDDAFRNGPE